ARALQRRGRGTEGLGQRGRHPRPGGRRGDRAPAAQPQPRRAGDPREGARPAAAPRLLPGAALPRADPPGRLPQPPGASGSPAALLRRRGLAAEDLVVGRGTGRGRRRSRPGARERRPMTGYILRRLLLMIPTLVGILAVSFVIIQFVPGGPVEQLVQQLRGGGLAGEVAATGNVYRGAQGIEAERIEEIRQLYGFDKPAPQRFWEMLERYAVFDLGNSYSHHKGVWQLIVEKLPVSMSLGIWSFLIVYAVSIPLGIAKAVRN